MKRSQKSSVHVSRRPRDTLFAQQKLPNLSPSLTLYGLAVVVIAVGIVFLPLGASLLNKSTNVFQQRIVYDGETADVNNCSVSHHLQGLSCQVSFTLDQTVEGPMYVYYELDHFYQNHRRYFQSKSISQLAGQDLSQSGVELDCSPLVVTENGTQLLNPCGLVANSFFTDIFTLLNSSTQPWYMDETGIALSSDRNHLYKQVSGFQQSKQYKIGNLTCETVGLPDNCKPYLDKRQNLYTYFYYPSDDSIQYLYETYPNLISPIEGVTNEHFIVWMKAAGLPTFRKLYGRVMTSGNFNAGDTLVFNITANYEVASYGASKALIITNLGGYGGKNAFPGIAYVSSGTLIIVFGFVLASKEYFKF